MTQSTLVGSVRTSLCHASSFRCPAVKYVSRSWQRFLAVVRGRGSWHWVLRVVLGSGSFAVVVCNGSSHCLRLSRLRGLQGSMPQFSDTCAFTPSIDCRQADNRSLPRDITWAPFFSAVALVQDSVGLWSLPRSQRWACCYCCSSTVIVHGTHQAGSMVNGSGKKKRRLAAAAEAPPVFRRVSSHSREHACAHSVRQFLTQRLHPPGPRSCVKYRPQL